MRVSREQAAENRARVVAAAARLVRESGVEGIGVDALAEAAGLTHGAVYSHFKSKDELAATAIHHALTQSISGWLELVDGLEREEAFARLVRVYVSRAHRDDPGIGCAVAALGGGNARTSTKLRRVLHGGIARIVDAFTRLSAGRSREEQRAAAIANTATMIGAVVMARAASTDEKFSEEILKTARAALIGGRAAARN